MIRRCTDVDISTMLSIVNDGARAYQGAIPADLWTEPYLRTEELQRMMEEGAEFWGWEVSGTLAGVMGLQRVRDVALIRKAYVRSRNQNQGIGSSLLRHLRNLTQAPILIKTWSAASWAIRFYQRHGFELVDSETKHRLLQTYWSVPDRQIATSVVLADQRWRGSL